MRGTLRLTEDEQAKKEGNSEVEAELMEDEQPRKSELAVECTWQESSAGEEFFFCVGVWCAVIV